VIGVRLSQRPRDAVAVNLTGTRAPAPLHAPLLLFALADDAAVWGSIDDGDDDDALGDDKSSEARRRLGDDDTAIPTPTPSAGGSSEGARRRALLATPTPTWATPEPTGPWDVFENAR